MPFGRYFRVRNPSDPRVLYRRAEPPPAKEGRTTIPPNDHGKPKTTSVITVPGHQQSRARRLAVPTPRPQSGRNNGRNRVNAAAAPKISVNISTAPEEENPQKENPEKEKPEKEIPEKEKPEKEIPEKEKPEKEKPEKPE
ncbi:hypothetical protein BGW38_001705, partial [Lunasporangiospora selenospora]